MQIRAITAFKVIQGHRDRYQPKARMRFPISDYRFVTKHACDRQTDRILLTIPRLHYMHMSEFVEDDRSRGRLACDDVGT